MIARIASRDSGDCVVVFAQGSYQFGLLDAGVAGTAALVVSGGASGVDFDVIKEGSLVHIYPQYGFGHWLGLVAGPPARDATRDTVTINAVELHGFLGDIQSVAAFDVVSGSGEVSGRWRT